MKRIDNFQLRKAIGREEFDYVQLCSVLREYRSPRQKIHDLLAAGVIQRFKKGLYIFGPDYNLEPICAEVLANLTYGPSCLSLEYALSYYGMIPERVDTYTSVTTKRKMHFQTPLGLYVYRHLPIELYPLGIELVAWDKRHSFLMASPEKALCDLLTLQPRENPVEELRLSTERLRPCRLRELNQTYGLPSIARVLATL